jgi:hypothetical protein
MNILRTLPLIIAVIIGIGAGTGGTLFIAKMIKPKIDIPACPACPPATEVKLQTLDMETLRKVKGNLTITQSLDHVTVRIDCSDSLMMKKLMKQLK